MKLAIQNSNTSWTLNWIKFCKSNNINFVILDLYRSDAINLLIKNSITHLIWHIHHGIPQDILMARNVIFSAKQLNIKVFPNIETCWHYDDKISQKYILEALGVNFASTYVFYSKFSALEWLKKRSKYPLIVKLRRGAGSYNVQLIKNYTQGKKYVIKMFGSGINPGSKYLSDIKNKVRISNNLKKFISKLKKIPNFFSSVSQGKLFPKEIGYAYFQEYIENNEFDVRVTIVGNKAWAFKRKNRKNDFRASGSGMIDYDISGIPLKLISDTFKISKKINAQSMAYDYLIGADGEYILLEISYAFSGEAIFDCPGYWNDQLKWINKKIWPEEEILKNLIKI